MRFEGAPIPGGSWVEIVHITNKDGTPIAEDNWRRKLFGRVIFCWIAGGFRQRGAFFLGKVKMFEGKVVEIDSTAERWTSTTTAYPVEVEPGVYDLETNTSVYRFRLLSEVETNEIDAALNVIRQKRLEMMRALMSDPPTADETGPVS